MKKASKVFYITFALVILTVAFGVIAPQAFESATGSIRNFINTTFGWYYLLIMAILMIFVIIIIVSPYGKIRLGKDSDRPEFSTFSWISMLFSAGMGIGLVFYGASEPLSHFAVQPATAVPGTDEAFKESLQRTFYHWGIHVWTMYGMVALSLAFFQFRKGQPALISSTLKPIFGDKMNGPLGTLVDVLAVFATVFGVATSLGFGAAQINGGLAYLFGAPQTYWVQMAIIGVVTILFIISAWSGLNKGIKYLSNTNMVLAVVLLVMVLILGPTLLILNMFTENFGEYIQNLISTSFKSAPLNAENRSWLDGWTIFYWAWWISWAPFVSMFIARVSKGRTIREFLTGVVLAPTIFGSIWFATFGTTAINFQKSGIDLASFPAEQTLFAMFNEMPFGFIMSIVAILLVSTFFITSADSATFVLGMQSTRGSLLPSNQIKILWGIAQSTVAAILLSVGGLTAVQNTIIVAALPFSFVIILMVISLFKALNSEMDMIKNKK
ncbi:MULTISPECIES: BCCT family transporter [Planococcus]|uniref:Glycine/betaine ABC transporter permease n=2 Tax=Planococcus TaxID=1372 RepID=A0ABM5WZV2_9BACL|nr:MULTISPECIES: BCCT family transporter [Planococcus]ALS79894.1 glycine/betaine ABC transporter permease [Planococcus kocurii]AQU78119.1 glycine/betaine ABC transporter permease [Planococcus faecalis]KAA0957302.1 BCCT family transporter [Planococcus sp. ANT_H30]MDJ0331249.1 BCCT family transporter [Planococcus sp. S3-L1]